MKTPKPRPRAAEGSWIEHVPIGLILPALRNPKEHDLPGIQAALLRWGFIAPLVENAKSGRIVAGHGRLAAAKALFAKDPKKVPRFVQLSKTGEWCLPVLKGISFASEQEAEHYLVAHNRWVEVGGWNSDELVPMLEQLSQRNDPAALKAIGWTESAIQRYLADFDADSSSRGSTPKDLAAGYNAGAVKQIVAYVAGAEVESVLGRLSAVMRKEKVDNNSDALCRLLAKFEAVKKLKPLRVAS